MKEDRESRYPGHEPVYIISILKTSIFTKKWEPIRNRRRSFCI